MENSHPAPNANKGAAVNHRHTLNIPGLTQPLSLHLHPGTDTGVSQAIRQQGIWEDFETHVLMDWLRAGDTFIDVGANLGYYTVLGGHQVGAEGHVYAFEPDPDNYHLLAQNSKQLASPATRLWQAALGDHSKQTRLYLNETNLGDHQLYDDNSGRSCIPVLQLKGDDVLTEVDHARLIKVDTQGAEWHVISGLKCLITRSLPDLAVMLEFWPRGLLRAGSSSSSLCDLLEKFRFDIRIIDHIEHQLVPTRYDWLRNWGQWSESQAGNEGFMNIWLQGE